VTLGLNVEAANQCRNVRRSAPHAMGRECFSLTNHSGSFGASALVRKSC